MVRYKAAISTPQVGFRASEFVKRFEPFVADVTYDEPISGDDS